MLSKGAFLLSLDTELAWGGLHNGKFRERESMILATRPLIGRLLDLLAMYDLHATWAVVGHLFLDGCPPGSRRHPELVRPHYPWLEGDWLDPVPCSTTASDPRWYAPDIIEAILSCPTRQEIGSHTFSHVIAGHPECSRRCFESEVRACVDAARQWGLKLTSFVYPRNSVAHLDVLEENGFRAFRDSTAGGALTGLPGPLGKMARGLRWVTPSSPLTSEPERRGGLWCLPDTSFYLHREGSAGWLPVRGRVWRAATGLAEAAREKRIFHLYLHPFNLASDPDGLLGGLEEIFGMVARLREQGTLDNPTMGDMARQLDDRTGSDGR
jgi:peptidoglycan/xylan/chitin deacetylase (PgdA/CDA1 family)